MPLVESGPLTLAMDKEKFERRCKQIDTYNAVIIKATA
jgi:hypothetical protein